MATNTNCGGLLIDNSTIVVDSTTKAIKVASGVVALEPATDAILGGVIPDGDVITVDVDGNITVADASDTGKGVVLQAELQADSEATTVGGLVTDFNALLLKLQTAGIMASE